MAKELDFDQISVNIKQYKMTKIEKYLLIYHINSIKKNEDTTFYIPSYLTLFVYFKQSPSNKK